MNKYEEQKQWKICVFCGAEEIKGKYAEKVYAKMIGDGVSKENANTYISSRCYLECPNDHKEKPNMIPIGQLKIGSYYHGSCRNARVARWNGGKFIYMREKFGYVYPEAIYYWEEGHMFDEFKPYGEMKNPPFDIPIKMK